MFLYLVFIQAPTNKPTSKPITDQPTSNPTQLPGDEDVPVTDAPTPAIVTTSSPSTSGVPGGEDVPVTDAPTKSTTESPTPVPTNEVRKRVTDCLSSCLLTICSL